MKAHTKETQSTLTPEKALQILKEGNLRFQNNLKANRNLLEQVNDTRDGQFPFAVVLSCIDSRTSAELIFDQGLGDIFSVRIAGNFVNEDILGSMEYACKVAGSKLVLVLGHTACGAVSAACDDVELGNITHLINNIKPAVQKVKDPTETDLRNSNNKDFVNRVAIQNITDNIGYIRSRSSILNDLEQQGEIIIAGAMYDVASGEVDFL
ncbi:MAG: carbonic anhydrase family protein [Flavobacteriaceae bacterium]|nr:carbonic anhydrase family protein [Flavobacteriaceae bacterium]